MQISSRQTPNILSNIVFALGLLILSPECLAGIHEKQLIYHLLDSYVTIERPVLYESDYFNVSLGLSLMQILETDEINRILVTSVWVKTAWNDINLRWNASEYGRVRSIRLPSHRIWEPDIYLYNNAVDNFDVTYPTKVVVNEKGSCLHVAPFILRSFCEMDLTWFPFDYQRCELKFGSWAYDGFELDIQQEDEDGGDLSSFIRCSEWELLAMPVKRNEIYYNCCPEPYIDITFELQLRRRPSYYLFKVIVPCIIMGSIALLVFVLPSDSSEKLTLGIVNFVSLTLYIIIIAGTTPTTPDTVPLIDVYLLCINFMVASSVIQTVLISKIQQRNTMMSRWFRVLFLHWLPRVLFMNRSNEDDAYEWDVVEQDDRQIEIKYRQPNGSDNESSSHTKCTLVEHELSLILKELRRITKQLNIGNEKRDVASDWKFASKVLDRLCFIIFTLFTVLVTIAAVKLAPDFSKK